jgi:hypothetical protein
MPGDQADAFFRHHAIGGVSWREEERPRAAKFVDYRVDLLLRPPFVGPIASKSGPLFRHWRSGGF